MHIILQAILIIGLSVGVALAGQFLVRRHVRLELLSAHTTVAGIIYATLAVVYGVILGQVVIAAWGDYVDAELAVDTETSALLNMHRLAGGWPAAAREPVQEAVVAYAEDVLTTEWPAMRRGDKVIVAGGYPPMLAIWSAVRAVADPAVRGSPEFDAVITQLTELEAARSQRLVVSERPLPRLLWLALIAGAVVTVAFSYLLGVENWQAQGMMVGALTGLVALLLFLVHTLQYPFQEGTGITPESFEVMLVETEPPSRTGQSHDFILATPGPTP